VGRIYDEVKGRPLYLVRARRNVHASAADVTDDAAAAVEPPLVEREL
jgi:hypothetical protein